MVSGGHILLVDDDLDYAPLMRIAFEQAGINNPVQVVSDGQAALDYLKGAGRYADRSVYPLPVLVVLDLRLPRLHGFDVLRWIREQTEFRTLPVIVLTGTEIMSEARLASELGATAYMVKPFEFKELVRVIEQVRGFGLQTPRR